MLFLNLNLTLGQSWRVDSFDYENLLIFSPNNQNKLFNLRKLPNDNFPANVDRLNLSQNVIFANCDSEEKRCSENKEKIEIWTEASDPHNDILTYEYIVSGGKIVGEGTNVIWDLSDVETGEYTITAGVDDGCGICGQTKTKKVFVIECPELSSVNYLLKGISNLEISRTEIFASCKSKKKKSCSKENNLIKVSAILPGSHYLKLIYKYEITGGQIVGNGAEVEWDLSKADPGNYAITASVDVGRGFCANSVSQSIRVVECSKCKNKK